MTRKKDAVLTSEQAAADVADYLARGKTIEQVPIGEGEHTRPGPKKSERRQKRGPGIVLGSHPWRHVQ